MSKNKRKVGPNGKTGATPARNDKPDMKLDGPWLKAQLHNVSLSVHELFSSPSRERLDEVHDYVLQALAEIQTANPVDQWAEFYDLEPLGEWLYLSREALVSAQTYFTARDDLIKYREALQRLDLDPGCTDEVAAFFTNGLDLNPTPEELPTVLADFITQSETHLDEHALLTFIENHVTWRAEEAAEYAARQTRRAAREPSKVRGVF